jgi:UDP-N-acetylglucosamine 2-epimerase (non-hydrolysing)
MNMALLRRLKTDNRRIVHLIFIGTKPDIIKQAPIYHALKDKNELIVVCHTGQHYDFNNSKAILEELSMHVDINFKIHGTITDKISQIICQTGKLISDIEFYDKKVIPYVHGDTLTAHGAALGAVLVRAAPVHVESGLRTMTPKPKIYKQHIASFTKGCFKFDKYLKDIKNINNYEHGSFEPFPEQIDTRIIDEIAAIKFVPTRINFDNVASERGLTDGISIVGNTISDAVKSSLAAPYKNQNLISLSGCKNFVFFTVHRRETCEDLRRFNIIIDLIEQIAKNQINTIIVMHPMFLHGVELTSRQRFRKIITDYPDVVSAIDPIPYHSDAIKIIKQSRLVVTDSGGIQEETNILEKYCVTLRYGTDRIYW